MAKWWNKLQFIDTMDYNTRMDRNEVLIRESAGMNLPNN